ncbi:Trp biosynthesis-associated membrane protein [Actinophytocola sp.]|uniref:Trp biosynthesis-associated membrane protein n=1 Tax=Actinophytocola sp. TaxID=1872138 RepID=UPI0025C28422|nr:Trp biosynthesis-associated membrane protein [Actinophytocola sp.]
MLLLAAAAALWGSTRISWGVDTPRYGTALALAALAGFAGTVAVGGWGKRVVGAVVVITGVLAGAPSVTADGTGLGRWIALLGAVLLVVAGLLVIRSGALLPTLGARYQSANARRRSGDPDKDMWDGLSHGEDPTVRNPEDER